MISISSHLSKCLISCFPIVFFIIYVMMNSCSICLFIALLTLSTSLSAQLNLIDYDPLIFQLSFTSPVLQPSFQLLYNNIYDIPYTVASTQSNRSDVFTIHAELGQIKDTSKLQSYQLLFNSPLTVGGGNLQISCYTLKAKKAQMVVDQSFALGIFLLVCAYFFNMFTQMGKLAVQFMQVYLLLLFHNKMPTNLYIPLYRGLLIIPPKQILLQDMGEQIQSFVLLCLAMPLSLLWFFAIAGYICKKVAPQQRAVLGNIIYEQFTFDIFIQIARIFYLPIMLNSIQFLILLVREKVPQIVQMKTIGGVLVYFNLITCLALLYFLLYTLNPKIGQNQESWQLSQKSQGFKDFRAIHRKVSMAKWYTRNYTLFNALRVTVLVSLYFWSNIFQYLLLLVQFGHIYYIFVIRPYKEDYYVNLQVICRLCFLATYLLVALGSLYYTMGPLVFNYYTAYEFVIARHSVFLTIIFSFFIAVFFEIYALCTNLTYKINLVRQENKLKFQFVHKKTQTDNSNGKKQKFVLGPLDSKSKRSSKMYDSISDLTNSPRRRTKKRSGMTGVEDMSEQTKKTLKNQKKTCQAQIEMVNLKEMKMDRIQSASTHKKNGKPSDREEKWKKESLLQKMIQKE